MEVLVPAVLLALLCQLVDRPALLTAILADRYRKPLVVALGAGLAHGTGNVVAAIAAMTMAPILAPNAQSLLLGVALVLAGLGGLLPFRTPKRLDKWHLGVLGTAFLGIFALALGDRSQFFTLALATRGLPWFAAAGATVGAFAVAFVAAVLGEKAWQRLPLHRVRLVSAVAFLIAGLWIGLVALRLA